MIGSRLGNWVIDKELGQGGMGRVYLAHEDPPATPDGRQAAVKVLAAELTAESSFRLRFQREIDILRKLDHPNIVRLYDAGSRDNLSYYAMEYVDGRDFNGLLQEQGRLPWKEVLDMALQVCPALKHAHDHGIIHRDLKPSNLMRTAAGVVKLTDFGVAQVFAGEHWTRTGAVVGTAEYLSPEQALGKPASKRSDLYSLGTVLYTLLTGRTPFQGPTIPDVLHKHAYAQFDRPQKLLPELPYEIDEVICQLLEKDPARRPADARVLQRQLESIGRKLERKGGSTLAGVEVGGTATDNPQVGDGQAGPATLMSGLMREELERQKRGGLLAQLLNRAWVLVLLLLLCGGAIVWAFVPPSAESLFQSGRKLMESENTDDWLTAWDQYFEPLNRKHPDHPYKEQVEQYREQIEQMKNSKARAPTLRQWRKWYEERADIPETVREFIAREVLKVEYQPREKK
jgi:serine/threonine-protein kinase